VNGKSYPSSCSKFPKSHYHYLFAIGEKEK
jgi:hypothetical protein